MAVASGGKNLNSFSTETTTDSFLLSGKGVVVEGGMNGALIGLTEHMRSCSNCRRVPRSRKELLNFCCENKKDEFCQGMNFLISSEGQR